MSDDTQDDVSAQEVLHVAQRALAKVVECERKVDQLEDRLDRITTDREGTDD